MHKKDYIGSDDKVWPSATELTSLLPQDWLWSWYRSSVMKHGRRGWMKCKAQSNRGMRIGTEVHSIIEAYTGKQDRDYIANIVGKDKYNSQQIADALFDKVNPLVYGYVAIEPHVSSTELKIHGTADAIVNMAEGLTVLDWKTSASRSETHPIQLAVYAICWSEDKKNEPVNRGVIARVDKKSKKLTVHLDVYENLEQYRPIVQALRTIWEYSKGGDNGKEKI